MKTVTVRVSDDEERLLVRHAAEAGFRDVSEYLELLVRSHLESHASLEEFMPADELEAALRKGIESGEPIPWDEAASRHVREETLRRLAERRKSNSAR